MTTELRRNNREACRAYYQKIKQDPERLAKLKKRKSDANHKQYWLMKTQHPEKYREMLRRRALAKRQHKIIDRPYIPSLGRKFDQLSAEEKRLYCKLKHVRAMAREHALAQGLDLYTVYQEWDCLFARDYPRMRNPLATKSAHTGES